MRHSSWWLSLKPQCVAVVNMRCHESTHEYCCQLSIQRASARYIWVYKDNESKSRWHWKRVCPWVVTSEAVKRWEKMQADFKFKQQTNDFSSLSDTGLPGHHEIRATDYACCCFRSKSGNIIKTQKHTNIYIFRSLKTHPFEQWRTPSHPAVTFPWFFVLITGVQYLNYLLTYRQTRNSVSNLTQRKKLNKLCRQPKTRCYDKISNAN